MKIDIICDASPGVRDTFDSGDSVLQPHQEEVLVREHLPLVKHVVNSMRSRLPANADLEELQSVGNTGLMSAVKRFDEDQAVTFRAYASTRIRGAILDELRKLDSLPRTRRAQVRKLNAAVEELEQKLGRAPRDEEIAKKLDLSVPEFCKLREKVKPNVLVSLDCPVAEANGEERSLHEAIADDRDISCQEQMEKRELMHMLHEHVHSLPERQRQIVSMYYFENMRLASIAEVFGVTEARICQIHTQAVAALRASLEQSRAA